MSDKKDYGTEKTYTAGDFIFHCGEKNSNQIYYIEDGTVELNCTFENGNTVTLATRTSGDWFGYEDCLSKKDRTYDALASTDLTIQKLTAETFTTLCQKDTDLLQSYITQASSFHRNLIIRLTNSLCLSAKIIVARDILRQYLEQHKNKTISVDFKGWAAYLGLRQETLSRALQQLKKEGIITSDRRSITILQLENLSDFSMQDYSYYT